VNSSPTFTIACDLIRRQSVTPEDAGCLQLIAERLSALGFNCQMLPFGEVSNLWAIRGTGGPLLVFAGHTDVVPTGPLEDWRSPPFDPTIHHDCNAGEVLTGRGAADMKGSLAAMVTACEDFLAAHPNHRGRLGFLLTSDEEGPAHNGTRRVMDWLDAQGITIDWCIVGEPTSEKRLGDTIKNGRRGSLNFALTVNGQQGHIAYPQLADNPIHRLAPALAELTGVQWDQGDDYFPPTSFQVSNINGGTGVTNVIPGSVRLLGNFRFSPAVSEPILRQRTEAILERHGLNYHIDWQLSGQPFLTPTGELTEAVSRAIFTETQVQPFLSTSGGTSDGRFIAPGGAQVIEFGPINATIHKVNECINTVDLDRLSRIYRGCLQALLVS
jgi:succinyl-diaminopimelate desuccinylase